MKFLRLLLKNLWLRWQIWQRDRTIQRLDQELAQLQELHRLREYHAALELENQDLTIQVMELAEDW
jgi:hypothetical protein